MSILGKRIRELRIRHGLTQGQLAQMLENTTQGQLSTYERIIDPKPEVIVQLANALKCTTDYLLGRSPIPEGTPDDLSAEERALIAAIRAARNASEIDALALRALEADIAKQRKPRSKRHS